MRKESTSTSFDANTWSRRVRKYAKIDRFFAILTQPLNRFRQNVAETWLVLCYTFSQSHVGVPIVPGSKRLKNRLFQKIHLFAHKPYYMHTFGLGPDAKRRLLPCLLRTCNRNRGPPHKLSTFRRLFYKKHDIFIPIRSPVYWESTAHHLNNGTQARYKLGSHFSVVQHCLYVPSRQAVEKVHFCTWSLYWPILNSWQ